MAQVNEKGALDKPLSDKTKVRGKDTVAVYTTAKAPKHAIGTELTVHPLLAEKLIESGKAVANKADATEKGGKQK